VSTPHDKALRLTNTRAQALADAMGLPYQTGLALYLAGYALAR